MWRGEGLQSKCKASLFWFLCFIEQQGELVGQKQSWEVGVSWTQSRSSGFSPRMRCVSCSAAQALLPFSAAKYAQCTQKYCTKRKKMNLTTYLFTLTESLCAGNNLPVCPPLCRVHSSSCVTLLNTAYFSYCTRNNPNNRQLFCLCRHKTGNSAAEQCHWRVHFRLNSKISRYLQVWKTFFTLPAKINTNNSKNRSLCIVYCCVCVFLKVSAVALNTWKCSGTNAALMTRSSHWFDSPLLCISISLLSVDLLSKELVHEKVLLSPGIPDTVLHKVLLEYSLCHLI